jgi:hypothetical protein
MANSIVINADENYTPLDLPGGVITLGKTDYTLNPSDESVWESVLRSGDNSDVDTILDFFDAVMPEEDAAEVRERLENKEFTSMYMMWAFQKLLLAYQPLISTHAQALGAALKKESDSQADAAPNRRARRAEARTGGSEQSAGRRRVRPRPAEDE